MLVCNKCLKPVSDNDSVSFMIGHGHNCVIEDFYKVVHLCKDCIDGVIGKVIAVVHSECERNAKQKS